MVDGLVRAIGSGAFLADDLAVTFGVLFSAIWGISALYALVTVPSDERGRLFAYFVPAAVGGIGVAFAADAVSFYLCFALMALPSWGLVTHPRTAEAHRAGTAYLGVTVLGEALLLAALMLLAAEAKSIHLAELRGALAAAEHAGVAFALVVAAFGLKLGAIGASGALPLTYGTAPAGAASALAGATVKVGVLGLLRLLPLGEVVPDGWGAAVIVLGLLTAFGAAALGVLTATPKAVLGYSSASQMGLVLIGIGAGMADPAAGSWAIAAAVAYSVHHGLAKATLFLGEDVVRHATGRSRRIALAALALPALALVGAPLTSGFVAKYALKHAVHDAAGALPHLAGTLLSWAAVGTALLMIRFFVLLMAEPIGQGARTVGGAAAPRRAPGVLWAFMLALVAGATWLWPAGWAADAAHSALDPSSLFAATWPGLVALAAALLARQLARGAARLREGVVPPGDLVAGATRVVSAWLAPVPAPETASVRTRAAGLPRMLLEAEGFWTVWAFAAGVFVVVAVVLVLVAA